MTIQSMDAEQTERDLQQQGLCDHQTAYGLPWMEYCGGPKPCLEHDYDLDMARLRLDQIEQRLLEKHPKAARDGVLASMLGGLRDALTDNS